MDPTGPPQIDDERRLILLLEGLMDRPESERRRWLEGQATEAPLVDELWRMLAEDDEGFLAEPAIRVLHRARNGKPSRSGRS